MIIFSAYASPALMLPAALAEADGLLDKGVGARELFEAIRLVNRGERLLGEPSAPVLREALARIPDEDRALVGMLLDGARARGRPHAGARAARRPPRRAAHAERAAPQRTSRRLGAEQHDGVGDEQPPEERDVHTPPRMVVSHHGERRSAAASSLCGRNRPSTRSTPATAAPCAWSTSNGPCSSPFDFSARRRRSWRAA